MQEIWLPVVGYEGFYEVSTLGRVRSILSEEEVLWIRESQQSSLKLAPILGVASSTIRAIRLRTNWSRI